MNNNIFLVRNNIIKNNNENTNIYIKKNENIIKDVNIIKDKHIIKDVNIADTMTKKYNPDVLEKFNELKRPNEFQLKNDFYKPITNNIPENIISSDDLIIFKGEEKDKHLIDKYNLLNNERIKENDICLEMQKKFKNMKIMMIEKEDKKEIEHKDDTEIDTFIELKMNIKDAKTQSNKLDNILSRLKDLNIDM